MMPLIGGNVEELYSPEEMIGGEMNGDKWMRQGSFKAVLVSKPYGDGNWHLYDVENDPGETKDLAAKMPEKLDTLKSAWAEYSVDVGIIAAE